jgi:hypothetical protein
MNIVIGSGLRAAVDSVQPFLDANSVDASVQFGWKERPRRDNKSPSGANRVVFEPSLKSGGGGTIEPARFPGQRNVRNAQDEIVARVRSLRDWKRKVFVSVWAIDNASRDDEAAQIEATEALFEWVVRAVHAAPGAFGAVTWGAVEWTTPVQRSFGLELRAELTMSHPIYDAPRVVAFPTAASPTRALNEEPPEPPEGSGDT